MARIDKILFSRLGQLLSACGFSAWLAGCPGAIFSESPDAGDVADASEEVDAADMVDRVEAATCPAPADVRTGTACNWTGPPCPSLESPWPPECGNLGPAPPVACICSSGNWYCPKLAIACVDAGSPSDAGDDAADAPPCPAPEKVRKDEMCSPSFLSCPSIENKIPACIGGYEPTTCHCLSHQWSCEFYGLPCPDAGRSEAGDGAGSDGEGDSLEAASSDAGARG